ncbi:MAG: hypothetical protein E4G90_09035 [Gemmatimonadales bacterium]|nr:MAG: hypothetical protein E4G90_09035 [Gemmatimonadales bacterium]
MTHVLRTKLDLLVELLTTGPESSKLWDIVTAMRGPDSPSERPSDAPTTHRRKWAERVERKMQTVAVIRGEVFGATSAPGSARMTRRSYVRLPKEGEWDHYDKHVARAARALELELRFTEESA